MTSKNSALIKRPNIDNPDDIYERLIKAHDGLSDDDSTKLNAKLILLLLNHIGDEQTIIEALNAAKPQ